MPWLSFCFVLTDQLAQSCRKLPRQFSALGQRTCEESKAQ